MTLGAGMRARHRMIAIVAASVASVGRVRADDGSVVVGGGAEEHERAVVGAAVAAAARDAGWSLPRDPLSRQEADRLLDCGDPARLGACVPASFGSQGIRRILVFAVDRRQAETGAPMIVLTARLIVTAPDALMVRQRFCEHCADDRLSEASSELARQLLQDLAVRTGRTILEVKSSPDGARITLDGRPIGATNASFNTFPGAHVVLIEKPGYLPATRSVIAREGKTAAVAVSLVAAGGVRSPGRGRLATAALLGGGALGVIAGGILIDLGGARGRDDKYQYGGAAPAGALVGLVGAAAIAAGMVRWWHRAPASAPTLVPSSGGVVAGWVAAF